MARRGPPLALGLGQCILLRELLHRIGHLEVFVPLPLGREESLVLPHRVCSLVLELPHVEQDVLRDFRVAAQAVEPARALPESDATRRDADVEQAIVLFVGLLGERAHGRSVGRVVDVSVRTSQASSLSPLSMSARRSSTRMCR
jgi:hypothetical protein